MCCQEATRGTQPNEFSMLFDETAPNGDVGRSTAILFYYYCVCRGPRAASCTSELSILAVNPSCQGRMHRRFSLRLLTFVGNEMTGGEMSGKLHQLLEGGKSPIGLPGAHVMGHPPTDALTAGM